MIGRVLSVLLYCFLGSSIRLLFGRTKRNRRSEKYIKGTNGHPYARTSLVNASEWCNAVVNLLFNIEEYMGN